MKKKYKWVFWGTPNIAVHFLEKLKELKISPDLIVTNPDSFVGRKKILTPSPVAHWAEKNNITILKPKKINDDFIKKLKSENWDFFFVLAYGKILKPKILEIPQNGVLNLHPSLLPQYRGPSPIMSAILDDQKETGISLMLLDEKMDHGPIIAQQQFKITEWQKNSQMEKIMAELGAELFYQNWDILIEKIKNASVQNDKEASYCQKYQKADMELTSPLNSRQNWLKYCAFPKPFYFDENGKRNIITQAVWEDNNFVIQKIIPEGKKERDFMLKY